jgi:Domain of unknown function (DU1801)
MTRNTNKTQPTTVSPRTFLSTVEPLKRRQDGLVLLTLFNRVTNLKPKMWGPSIIGYGRYHYKYDSGREGEFFLTGFSPRKTALTIYILPGYRDLSSKLKKLGPHKTGKSCLYLKDLDTIDKQVLEEIIQEGLVYMRANYQTWNT